MLDADGREVHSVGRVGAEAYTEAVRGGSAATSMLLTPRPFSARTRVALLRDPAPSEPVLSLTDGLVIVSREAVSSKSHRLEVLERLGEFLGKACLKPYA
jgi:hypothetical protein